MIDLPVSLRRHGARDQEATAACIRGGEAAVWLNELEAWPGNVLALRLYCVPESLRSRRPAALLVIPPPGTPLPPATARLQHYACRADALYLPVGTMLQPPLHDDELHQLLIWPVSLLHPTIGLVGFDLNDAMRVQELLQLPTVRQVSWYGANPGLPEPPRLQGVQLLPESRQLLSDAQEEIGSRSVDDLANDTDEQRSFMQRVQRSVLGALSNLQKKPPAGSGGAGEQGVGANLWQWVNERIAALESLRQREIDRLVKLMERDPDEGLKYAVPLANRYQGRGVAEPRSALSAHEIDFKAESLGGGQVVDSWQMGMEEYRRLRESYVQAARRELGLQRHRRAAYILAHLLGDYHGAANALEQGGHWQEAALLYREHLNRPLAAATCLTRCGLLQEAANLYMEEEHYERAGDLYLQLEQQEPATTCYRHAVARLLSENGDYLGAARLLETKLDDPEEALRTLLSAWPDTAQAEPCLRAWFEQRGARGEHGLVQRQIHETAARPLPDRQLSSYVTVLAEMTAAYPDPAVRKRATDTARVLVGKRLQLPASRPLTRQLLDVLPNLRPADPYLSRDCLRFATQQRTSASSSRSTGAGRLIEPVEELSFTSEPCTVLAGMATDAGFVALIQLRKDLQLVRGAWFGDIQRATWYGFNNTASLSMVLGGGGMRDLAIVYSPLDIRLPERCLPPLGTDRRSLAAGTPQWLDGRAISVSGGPEGYLVLQRQEHGFILCEYSTEGQLLVTRVFDSGERSVNELAMQPQLRVWRDHIYLCWGQRLWWLRTEPLMDIRVDLPGRARFFDICGSLSYPQLAVAGDDACLLLWPDARGGSGIERLSIDNVAVTALGFLPDGNLIVAERTHARYYQVGRGEITQLGDLRTEGTIVAVLPIDRGKRVGLLNRHGRILIYEGLSG